jgi:hypothetical protein
MTDKMRQEQSNLCALILAVFLFPTAIALPLYFGINFFVNTPARAECAEKSWVWVEFYGCTHPDRIVSIFE